MKNTTKRAAKAAIGLSTLLALALIGTGCPTDGDGDGGSGNGNGNGLTVTAAGSATSVQKGGTLQFSVSPQESVTWSITTSGVAGGTSIDTTGLLTVAADEANSSLAIKAESTADASRSGTATVTVTDAGTGSGLTVTGAATSVAKGGTLQFSVSPQESVTWSITTSGVAGGTSISTTGLLTVAADEAKSSLAIKAVSTADASKSGTATVTVTDAGSGGNPEAGELKTLTLSGVSVPMRYVPAGSFQRDATATNISVITKGYWLAETEVTQELFQAVMGSNPSNFDGTSGYEPATDETQNQRPAEKMNWYAAIAFCNKLSLANSKQAVYSVKVRGNEVDWASLSYAEIPTSSNSNWNAATMDTSKNGYRLPTEMEWMWAAMGADKTAQPNTSGRSKAFAGSDGSNSIDGYVWYSSNSGSKTHEVGKKGANELGLKDMSGNVWEWCWDMYDGTYGSDGTVAATGELTDFTGAASGSIRVLRGGSWFNVASDCVVAYRTDNSPDSPAELVGCRFGCPAQQ